MTKLSYEEENKLLRAIITDIFYMAERYAKSRKTYAPEIIKERKLDLWKLGFDKKVQDNL